MERDRKATPFFPAPWGQASTMAGNQTPIYKEVPARELVGQLVGNGRYLIQSKAEHSIESVSYTAHDLVGGIEVKLDLHPDRNENAGFRIGRTEVTTPRQSNLPNLYSIDTTREQPPQGMENDKKNVFLRVWESLRGVFK